MGEGGSRLHSFFGDGRPCIITWEVGAVRSRSRREAVRVVVYDNVRLRTDRVKVATLYLRVTPRFLKKLEEKLSPRTRWGGFQHKREVEVRLALLHVPSMLDIEVERASSL